MDSELKQYLDEKFTESEGRLVTLITSVKESLEHQMNTGFEEISSRFEVQSNRLDRQAALIQTGSRWTNRMNDWAESVDIALDKKSREIADLRARLDKLQNGTK